MRILEFGSSLMPWNSLNLLAVPLAFGIALACTPLVRTLARRGRMVAHPRQDRWHKQPTALLGGVAIFLAVAGPALLVQPYTPETLTVLGASTFLGAVGLVDDFRNLKPYQKLIGQITGTTLVISVGLELTWTAAPLVNLLLTLLWLVGITNALNLLDNMDGLAAGIAAIASIFLAINLWISGQPVGAAFLAVLAAALLGFLVYNTNPASIFMGDCGSMFVGFFLASAALLNPSGGRTRSLLPVLAVPVLVLAIPIFDITLVTVLRKRAGRPASQGGRDHTSHRLVALGMSERSAVLLLYALAALAGAVALLVRGLDLDVSLAVMVAFTLALTSLGIYLARVRVYGGELGQGG